MLSDVTLPELQCALLSPQAMLTITRVLNLSAIPRAQLLLWTMGINLGRALRSQGACIDTHNTRTLICSVSHFSISPANCDLRSLCVSHVSTVRAGQKKERCSTRRKANMVPCTVGRGIHSTFLPCGILCTILCTIDIGADRSTKTWIFASFVSK